MAYKLLFTVKFFGSLTYVAHMNFMTQILSLPPEIHIGLEVSLFGFMTPVAMLIMRPQLNHRALLKIVQSSAMRHMHMTYPIGITTT